MPTQPDSERSEDGTIEEQIKADIQSVRDRSGRGFTPSVYARHGSFPMSAIERIFGSWANALDAAQGSSERDHGIEQECECGEVLHSKSEKKVGDLLHEHCIAHTIHKELPGLQRECDFYLPEYDLWIEVDGYGPDDRPNPDTHAQKIHYYRTQELNYVEIEQPLKRTEETMKRWIRDAIS